MDSARSDVVRTFTAQIESLYEMLHFIRHYAQLVGIDEPHLSHVELASEELLVNVIHHAYPAGTRGLIAIECHKDGNDAALFTIKDQGVPFDPVRAASQAPHEPLAIGGYGVYLVIEMMDAVTYSREDDTNVVVMKKKICPPPSNF